MTIDLSECTEAEILQFVQDVLTKSHPHFTEQDLADLKVIDAEVVRREKDGRSLY